METFPPLSASGSGSFNSWCLSRVHQLCYAAATEDLHRAEVGNLLPPGWIWPMDMRLQQCGASAVGTLLMLSEGRGQPTSCGCSSCATVETSSSSLPGMGSRVDHLSPQPEVASPWLKASGSVWICMYSGNWAVAASVCCQHFWQRLLSTHKASLSLYLYLTQRLQQWMVMTSRSCLFLPIGAARYSRSLP